MKKFKSMPKLMAALVFTFLPAFSTPALAQCAGIKFCELVWSDEFDGTAVDTTKWSFQLGDGTEVGLPAGWGNGELQWYTDQNATVADGFLTITARRETGAPGFPYTSTRLRSLNKGEWTYGRMEMRAKMPVGAGLWPAFWMLSSNQGLYGGWAASGEIDIVEYIGSEPDRIFGTIHYGGNWPNNVFSSSGYQLPAGTFDQDFHVFAIEWEEEEIRWYVDDIHYATQNSWYSTAAPFPAPFDVDFHLLLNLAVGGNLPGPPNNDTQFPQDYVIDYVRVYQQGAAPTLDGSVSGAYVAAGLNDQGFIVTVGENPSGNFFFVAWFTYDEDGNQRWLVGNDFYQTGVSSIDLTMQEVTGLKFLDFSDSTGSRRDFGTITFTVTECGRLQADYDFGESGTGTLDLIKFGNIEGRDCGGNE
jgi:beta-glucanase (GH16 family)